MFLVALPYAPVAPPKVSSNKKITVYQSNKQQLEVSNKQIETITSQKESFEVLRKQKAIDDEIRVRIDTENSELKKKLVESNSKLKKLERDKNLNQIEEEEIKFLRLNLLYSHKCRKTMFNQLYKVNTLAYKACILTKEKR